MPTGVTRMVARSFRRSRSGYNLWLSDLDRRVAEVVNQILRRRSRGETFSRETRPCLTDERDGEEGEKSVYDSRIVQHDIAGTGH